MKKFLFLFVLLISITVKGQVSVASGGISIQGVARDSNGNVFANIDDFLVNIYLYYIDSNNLRTPLSAISRIDEPLSTDQNGVFSYVFDVPSAYFRYFEQHSLYILVGRGGVTNPQEVFVDQKLSAVPYAIYAHNGAPTGIILPFTGNTNDVPPGWVLCDGSALPSSVVYDDLRGIVGANTPDLRGVFLRGFGNINSTNLGPVQGAFQDDLLWEHTHLINLVSSEEGKHTHEVRGAACCHGDDGSTNYPQWDNRNFSGPEGYPTINEFIRPGGDHNHSVQGNTSSVGANETRPANYGVNYIIKI